MRVNKLIAALLLLCAVPCLAVNRDHIRELNKQASTFARQKDWQSLREVLIQIGQELEVPTPYQMLRMASAEVRLGNNEAALQWMSRYAATGLTYDVSTDDDLKPLTREKGFGAIADQMKHKSQAITKAEPACTFPVSDLMPEDLTYDRSSKAFVVSSVQHHSLYRVTLPKKSGGECELKEIVLDASVKKWPVFAVSIDNSRKLLWATAAAMAGFEGVSKEDEGRTALFVLDAATGNIVRRFDLQSSAAAVLGDMSIAPDGTVYVTDSIKGGVYRVRGDMSNAKLEKIADGLFSPQTPVLAADGKRIFVADYSVGVAVIDLHNGNVTYLRHPENIAVTGLDGLHLAGNSLIGVQNGTDPERIVRFQLNQEQTEISGQEIMEQGPRIGDPTHAVDVDGMIYATANVGWDKVDDQGKLKAGKQFTAPLLIRFPVK